MRSHVGTYPGKERPHMQVKAPPMLVSLSEACERLSLSRRTVWRLIEDGHLQSVKVRGKRMITAEALRRFVQRLQTEGGVQ
jgi:excisionase family DNA binding protein